MFLWTRFRDALKLSKERCAFSGSAATLAAVQALGERIPIAPVGFRFSSSVSVSSLLRCSSVSFSSSLLSSSSPPRLPNRILVATTSVSAPGSRLASPESDSSRFSVSLIRTRCLTREVDGSARMALVYVRQCVVERRAPSHARTNDNLEISRKGMTVHDSSPERDWRKSTGSAGTRTRRA